MMPGYDGLDVTRRLRREGNRTPILLLRPATRSATGSRGSTPAPTTICRSRSRSRSCSPGCARCSRRADQAPAELLRFADLTFDVGSMEARRGGRRFELTTTEAHLLELFMRNPARCCRAP